MSKAYSISDLKAKRDKLRADANALIERANAYDLIISELEIDSPKLTIGEAMTASAKKTVSDKILDIINKEGRFLYRREILDLAPKYGITLAGTIKASISAAKNDMNSPIVMHKLSGNAATYGRVEWVDNGSIVKGREHKYNEDYERNT